MTGLLGSPPPWRVSPVSYATERLVTDSEWVLYLDESQQKDVYFVGAALARSSTWYQVEERLGSVRESASSHFGLPPNVEFHGHPLMNGKQGWEALKGKHRETANVYLRAMSSIDELPVWFWFCGVDVKRLNARYKYPRRPHSVCMGHAFERVNDWAGTNGIETVRVIADETSEERQLQNQLDIHHVIGTDGFRPSRLERIASPMEFRSSAATAGLQVIDLALYMVQRSRHVPQERNPKAQASRARITTKIRLHTVVRRVWTP